MATAGSLRASPAMGHQACERCWKRKQKCDRQLPSCTTCASLGVVCQARSVQFDLADDNPLSHASTLSYFLSLQRRVDGQPPRKRLRLDGSTLGARAAQPPLPTTPRARTAASEAGTSSTRMGTLRASASAGPGTSAASSAAAAATGNIADPSAAPSDADGIRAMMGEIGFLSRSALGEPRDDEPTPAAQRPLRLALDRVVAAALALDGHDPGGGGSGSGSAGAGAGATPLPSGAPAEAPDPVLTPAAAVHLRRFLDEIAVRFPHLATTKAAEQLESQFEAVTTAALSTSPSASLPSASRFYVFLAVATGALLAPDAARLRAFSQRLHAAAVRLLPAMLATTGPCSDALSPVRALVALVLYATLSPDGGSAWHLLGIASKRCIVLGLRREPDAPQSAEADERRRLFWSVYLMDRSIGLAMDRPFSIQDEDISVHMSDDSFFSLSHHLVVQARLVSAVRTQARPEPLFDYSNFCYWRDFPPPLDHLAPDVHDTHTDYLHLLACRTLIHIAANCMTADAAAASSSSTLTTSATLAPSSVSSSISASASAASSAPTTSTTTPQSPKLPDTSSPVDVPLSGSSARSSATAAAAAAGMTAASVAALNMSPSEPSSSSADANVGLLSGHGLLQTIGDDAALHCRGLIERAYARADRELFVGSFIDAYDLFAAGVVYLCLTSRRHARRHDRHDRRSNSQHHLSQSLLETTDLLNKCTMLITSIGERFSALKPLRRVLVALLARLRARQMAHASVPALNSLPAIVPTYLRRMIEKWL